MKDNQFGFVLGMIYGSFLTRICMSAGRTQGVPIWVWIVLVIIWLPIIYIRIADFKKNDTKKES